MKSSVEDTTHNVKNSIAIGQALTALHNRIIPLPPRDFVLTLGGDHSVGSATILAALKRHPTIRVLWVDAHGDCNTPEISESHNYHGMSAAHAMGWFKGSRIPGFDFIPEGGLKENFLHEDRLVYIGLRDLDDGEKKLLRQSKCKYFTMQDIDRLGIATVMELAIAHLDAKKYPVHLTFDIDAVDPVHAPGTGTLARGGLSYREAHYLCERIHET
ncbi:hydrolase, partial [Perkinsus sp. BL_2016]